MKKIMCIVALMTVGCLDAQKSISEMAKLFGEGTKGDVVLTDGTIEKNLEYWLNGGVLYKKMNENVQSIALIDIDFSRETISQNASEVVVSSKRKAVDLGLSSKKPKKTEGMNLSFECVDDALLAFRYLKMQYEKGTNELLLGASFSNNMAQILKSGAKNFKTISGEPVLEKDSVNKVSKVQIDGALLTVVRPGLVEIDFGDFDNIDAAVVAYKTLIQRIGKIDAPCCRLIKSPHATTFDATKSNIQTWTAEALGEGTSPDMILSLVLNENFIKLSIYVDVNTDE